MTAPRRTLAARLSEAEAIEGAKLGNGECFEILYRLHKKRIYSLCLRMVGNIDAAEDFTQEVFLQLYRKITSFRGESAFSTWLHRVGVNVVLMHLRRKGLVEVSLEETLDFGGGDEQKREFGFVDKALTGSIDRVILERFIESLSPGYRIIFVLHDIEGYEHNEIAEMLGCSAGNTKSQPHKARIRLRDLLNVSCAGKLCPKKATNQQEVTVGTGQGARAASAAVQTSGRAHILFPG
jgi:RNA polymerase sigma-70 factor (ECF subfamily)